MEKAEDKHGKCVYAMVSLVAVPRDANFVDYSDMALYDGHLAIVSQASGLCALYHCVPHGNCGCLIGPNSL
eukprot:scaffold107938_cov43-Prasinocladus_malaysianus.AAC.2